jgi:hypothetical protein
MVGGDRTGLYIANGRLAHLKEMSIMKNNKSSPYVPQSPKLRELLKILDEQSSKENHPLYKMGFEAGVKEAQEAHRKLTKAIARVYNIDSWGDE